MNKYIVALDVGGTSIKAGIITENGEILSGTYLIYKSRSKECKEIILNDFCFIVGDLIKKINEKDYVLKGIGIGFPGPFDYERGVSYIKEVDKFESLYGLNIADELRCRITNDAWVSSRFVQDFKIVFENDVNLFALGEHYRGKAKKYERSICIAIGTGTNSAYLINGALIKVMMDIPINGWIYNIPYRESIIDDYISRRGILNIAKVAGFNTNVIDVKEISLLAREGNIKAINVFKEFGSMLGEVLLPLIKIFKPDAIILGGQISISYDLFADSMKKELLNQKVIIEVSVNSTFSTLAGVSLLI
jgi:glucokinase